MDPARQWWRSVLSSDWTVFALPEDLVRERYTSLLAALEELSTRGPMWTPAQILEQMRAVGFHDPLTEEQLLALLEQVARWELAKPFRDYAAPVRNYRGVISRQESWALTLRGRAVVAAVRAAVLDARRALQLPTRLLDGVENTVRRLVENFKSDPGLLTGDLDDIRTRIDELQRVTADFYGALAQMVQSDVTDDNVFGRNRDRVLEALRQFPREYGRALRRVEDALTTLREVGHGAVVETAAVHAGLVDAAEQQRWVDERLRRLADLEAWFTPEGTVYRLIASATGAVHTLLIAIDRRYAARRRGADLGADFRSLARSLHRQSDERQARRVYGAAFGDWPAWHAQIGPAEEDVAHATVAAAGTAVRRVEVTLREHERVGRPSGRPRKVADTTADRESALAAAREEVLRRRRFAGLLVTPGEVGLDHFAGLPADAVTILLRAVETALQEFDQEAGCGAAVAEGANVVVRVRPGVAGRQVRVALAEGVLTGPDLRICVEASERRHRATVRGVA
ncbi:DUF2397 family protein [Streptomyces sp. NPDC021020]|uniref:DUF2397 family protein n=1 Tax=Streptomyces sp. NPDC021020 TaxID=3365109 RepID=UPI0037B79A2C